MSAKFPLGRVVATPGALTAIENAEQTLDEFLKRHAGGDWGNIDPRDRRTNDKALKAGGRLLSAYQTAKRDVIWIITEADRSATTILLPDDY